MTGIRLPAFCFFVLLAAIPLTAQQGPGGVRVPGGGRPGSGQPGSEAPVATARISEQSHAITVGGRLMPQSRIVHKATAPGYVAAIGVKVGQLVQAGEELLTIKRKDDVLDLYKPLPVLARISGRVSELSVQPETEVSTGEAVVTILGTEGYLMEASVSDKDAFRVDVGQAVSARTAAGVSLRGVLADRSPEPDYATGLFRLSFRFPDSQRSAIGEFVLVELPIDRTRGIFVPRDSVVRRYGKFFLWLIGEDRKLAAREVALGPVFGDLVLIRDGLRVGERYLVRLTGREREGALFAPAAQ